MSTEVKKEYTNGEITIVWKPSLCMHSEICVKTLPEVYKPKEKPWIQVENASTEALKDQVPKCPSGALTFYMNGEKNKDTSPTNVQAEVIHGGPLIVTGEIEIEDSKRGIKKKQARTAFCRCGQSTNKPYCDGSHRKIEFE